MDVLGISQNEVARQAGVCSGHLSQIMNGYRSPSPGVLKRLRGMLYQRTGVEERAMSAEVKVLGSRKGQQRQGWWCEVRETPAAGMVAAP